MTSITKQNRSRAWRVLAMLSSLLGAVVISCLALVAGVLVHVDLPASRRLVAAQANAVFDKRLAGRIRIDRVGALGVRGLTGARVTVHDPDGVQVLRADHVRVHVAPLATARSALYGQGPLLVEVALISIGDGEVNLDPAPDGELRIARAFAPRGASPVRESSSNKSHTQPARGVRVVGSLVRLEHVWVHGTVLGAPTIDADVSEVAVRARVDTVAASLPSVRAELERARVVARALPRRADPRGLLRGSFGMPSPSGRGVVVQATFDGQVGGVATSAEARVEDRHIDARIDARDRVGTQAGLIVSELAVREPFALHAEARGELPRVDGRATLALGSATVVANAVVTASTPLRVEATVNARDINVGAIAAGAPKTLVGLDAHMDLEIENDGPHGELALDTLPGSVDRQPLPHVEMRGRFSGRTARIIARIDDATMPTEISVDLAPRAGGARLVTAAVRSRIPDLRRVPDIGRRIGGRAELEATATLFLPERRIDAATASLVVSNLEESKLALRADRVEAQAHIDGTLGRPRIDAQVHATRLAVGRRLPLASLDAHARLEPTEKSLTVSDASLHVVRTISEKIDATAHVIRVAGTELRLEGGEVLGLGDPIRADMSKSTHEMRIELDAPRIDLPLVARFAGKDDLALDHGVLGARCNVVLRHGVARGSIHIEVTGLSVGSAKVTRVTSAGGLLDASISDRDLEFALTADVGDAGNLDLRTERLHIDGRVDDPRSWRRAHGRVSLAGMLDMERAAALAPPGGLPVADLRGSVSLRGGVRRDGPDVPHEVAIHAHTNGLALAGRAGPPTEVRGVVVEATPRWRLSDVELGFDIRTDGPSGLAAVSARATDRHGALVALDAKAILPFAELASEPARTRALALDAPISVRLTVPLRRIDELPSIAGFVGVRGSVDADLVGTGTLLDPRIRLRARTRGLHTTMMPVEVEADTDVALDYDGQKADLSAKVTSHGRELIDAGAHVEARARDFLVAKAAPWQASAHARLSSFPLESVPPLADRRIHGRVTGEVTLNELHRDARANGRIDLEGLTIGDATYSKGSVAIDAGGGRLAASVRLDQTDGFLDAKVNTGITWAAAVAPRLDREQPAEASFDAAAFRATALQPFVESIFPVIDGRIDANAKVRVVPGTGGAQLDGKVVLHDGTVQIAALGEELRSVRATATFAPDGTVRITDVAARGMQGAVRADGAVKFDGMRIADARANVHIPTRQPLFIALQGQPLGEVSGTIRLAATRPDANNIAIVVEVPQMAVQLPQVKKRGLQSLTTHPNVRVGVYREEHKFVMLPLQEQDLRQEDRPEAESRLDIDVRLGGVRVARGNLLRVTLSGNPKVTVVNGETRLTGKIDIASGWIDAQGKKFDIEKGTVSFNGDVPPNPTIVASAGWTAADGTRVCADFIGPASTGKVSLRSEPPRPKNEILALVLFGSADGANPQPAAPGRQSDGTTTAAVGLGGGLVAQGITEALDDLAGIQATARVDTTRSNNPRPEIEFQLSPKVSIAFSHVIGTPPIAEPDKNFANLEYRFHRNWSLETTFGDRGSALLDAIWQRRY